MYYFIKVKGAFSSVFVYVVLLNITATFDYTDT